MASLRARYVRTTLVGGMRSHSFGLATALLGGVLVAALFTLTILNREPPFYDPVQHFLDGIYLLQDPMASRLFHGRPYYPFLTSIMAIPANILGSYSYDISTATIESVCLVGTVVSTYLIGRDLYSRRAGFVAGLLLPLYPVVFGQSLTYMLDVPLMFAVAVTMLFLIRSESFTNRRYSLLLGAAVGFGTFTKFTYPLFVAGPLIVVTVQAVVHEVRRRRLPAGDPASRSLTRRALLNLVDAALVAALIAVPWYLPRLGFLRSDLLSAQAGTSVGGSTDWFLYYPLGLWKMTSLTLALAFVVFGLVYAIRGRSGRLVIAFWLLSGYLGMNVLAARELRYLVPVLPAVALATAAGMEEVARFGRALRVATGAVLAALVGFGAVQLYSAAVGIGWLPAGRYVSPVVRIGERPLLFSQDYEYVPKLSRKGWNAAAFIAQIPKGDTANRSRISVNMLMSDLALSVLKVPLVKASLVGPGPAFVLNESPGWESFPADIVLADEGFPAASMDSAGRRRLEDFLATTAPDVRYREVYRERAADAPFMGEEFVIYERVR